ncbi:hypothetical protein Syun_011209 [Stephania yunnanensis]|uniref:Uncharacterized protein n=1 Tax=Stephania yunnanensis TaxID=152371 RepID=A0AAP0JXU5_9MAGN
MAAEAIVSVTVEKLADLLIQEVSFLYGVKDQVRWIHRELKRMQSFLRDADNKQESDERIKNWVLEIRDVAFDAEDVIDTHMYVEAHKQHRRRLVKVVKFINDMVAHYKVGKEIERIKSRIKEISESTAVYGIQTSSRAAGEGDQLLSRMKERRRSSPHADEAYIIGVEEDVKMLESWMVDDRRRQLSFGSIVGMGGLGKTTLAKKVYNSRAVIDRFDCRAWVYVSQDYKARDLLQEIWNIVTNSSGERFTLQQLERELYEFLIGKRYLIVMDDVWTSEVWESVEAAFPGSQMGSRVLFTTRNRDVALCADPRSLIHQPRLLSDEDSWGLFLSKIFNRKDRCPPNLEQVGKQIVNKCGGLPLAIVVVGGLLSRKEASYGVWSRVLQRISWQLNQDETKCSQILALSYNDLPYYLKRCFVYIGVYPEDSEICVGRMVRSWIAEGLVEKRGSELLEDIAEDYVEELIDRSLIQVSQRRFNGKAKKCRMHDLLRDLSLLKADEAGVLHAGDDIESTQSIRSKVRRYVARSISAVDSSSLHYLHSFLCFLSWQQVGDDEEIRKFLEGGVHDKGFRLLRVLDLEGMHFPKIPDALGELIHLRYLGLRKTSGCELPSSLVKLRNLQTLDLKNSKINTSQCAIWKLQQLRHLYLNGDWSSIITYPYSSSSSSSLAELQTLWGVYVDKENRINGMLAKSTNLRKLSVHGDLMSQGDSLSEWLIELDRLEVLMLKPVKVDGIEYGLPQLKSLTNSKHMYRLHLEGRISGNLIGSNEFPPNLTMLTLYWCELEEDPMRVLEKLQNLRSLNLLCRSYIGKEMFCSSGGFPSLQRLQLDALEDLDEWTVEEGAMQNLQVLEIHACENLYMLPSELQHISTLNVLNLMSMPASFIARAQANAGREWARAPV